MTHYHSDINNIALKGFTETELNLLMAIMTQMKDQGLKEITYSFKELKDLVQYKSTDSDRFYNDVQSTYDKLIQCKLGWENEKEIVRFVLFTEYRVNKEKEFVTVGVNEKFYWVLNELARWTTFELSEFIALKGKYTKEIYRRMKEFRDTGYWTVKIDDFKRLLDVPKSYRMRDIDKVILFPAIEELKTIYPNFEIKKIEGKGRGKPIIRLEFIFDKEQKKATKNADGTFSKPYKNAKNVIKYEDYNATVQAQSDEERAKDLEEIKNMSKQEIHENQIGLGLFDENN